MSELPQGWQAGVLSELADIVRGVTYNKSQAQEAAGAGLLPILRANNIKSGKLSLDDLIHVPESCISSTQAVLQGDIVVAMSSGSRNVVGKTAQLETHWKGSFGAFCAVLRVSPDIDARYLYHFTQSHAYRSRVSELAAGVNINNLKPTHFEGVEVPVAPLAQQRRIAQELDALLAKVDALKARIDAVPQLIQRFRESVLRSAVSGHLTEDWRNSHPELTAKRLLKDFSPLPTPPRYKSRSDAHIMGVCATSIGKPKSPLVEAWEWVPLVQIARMESGHTPSRDVPSYWNGDIPWIGIKDARANHEGTIYSTQQSTNQSGLDNSAARLLPAETVCISRTASVGYVVKMGVPMATSQDFVNWVPTQYVDAEWLKWLFVAEKESLFRFGKGSTHTTIYFPEWFSLHVALPHIEEQVEIAKRVQQLLSLADGMAARINDAKKRIDALTQSILAKAFRGELVPQDPNDEPASVLLERIRAQRAAAPKPKRGRKAAEN